MANVYLIPAEDFTFKPIVSDTKPSDGAIFLTKEGAYPVSVWYHRHDINFNAIVERDEVFNRGELIKSLTWLGECQDRIMEIWDFDYHTTENEEYLEMMRKIIDRKSEIYDKAFEEMMRDIKEDEDCECECENIEDNCSEIYETDENLPF